MLVLKYLHQVATTLNLVCDCLEGTTFHRVVQEYELQSKGVHNYVPPPTPEVLLVMYVYINAIAYRKYQCLLCCILEMGLYKAGCTCYFNSVTHI